MSGSRFGPAAAALCGKAALLLGWKPGDFWTATPQELRAMLAALMPEGGTLPLDTDTLTQMIARDEGQVNG